MTLDKIINKEMKRMKKYIITSAQYCAPANHQFLNSLETYARENNAEILVLPMLGKHRDDNQLHRRFMDYRTVDELKLNDNIRISGYQLRPQQIDPSTGIARFAQRDTSTIFASPKQRMKYVPNNSTNEPKVIMGTGASTHPYYRDNRLGRIASKDHVYGALMVELDGNKRYHFRQLTALKNGKFCDLGVLYDNNRAVVERPEAMVLGDWHVGDTDEQVRLETFDMIRRYKPKRVFIHDFFNGYSINHHNLGQIVTQANQYQEHGLNLGSELALCGDEMFALYDALPSDSELVFVRSNHDEFLSRYLQSGRFINEPQNILIASKLLTAYLEGKDPLRAGIGITHEIPRNVTFLERDERYLVRGWQLGEHGDVGANGARGSIRSTENALGKSISGHKHTPEIQRNTYVVGTSTRLKLDYNRGYSSWFNTHAFLYSNGKSQLINIVDGKHRK